MDTVDTGAQDQHGEAASVGATLVPRGIGPWLVLAASLALALGVYYGFIGSALVDWVAGWTANWSSQGLNVLGASTRVDGTILASDRFAVNIVAECTAVGPLLLLIGAVAAYPSPIRARVLGVLAGVVILSLVNVVRIMSLFWIGTAYPDYLDVAHLLVWQTAIILFSIVLWLVWVGRVADAQRR